MDWKRVAAGVATGGLSEVARAAGGSSDAGKSSSSSSPWGPQQEYLKKGFEGAQDLYDKGPQSYFPGSTVAGVNPMLQSYFGGMGRQTQTGIGAGQDIMGYGQQGAQGLGQAQSFYSDALNNYYNPYASAEYADIVSGSVNNNPLLDQQIASAQGDINRNMQENIMPSIASGSVGTGNTGSTRRGVAEGIAMRGAGEAGADAALGLRSNAYNQGLQQADQWAGSQFDSANMMNQMGQQGVSNIAGGYGLGSSAYQDLMGAGAYERGIQQEGIAGEIDRYKFNQNAGWDNLQRYQQAVSGNYGGETTGQVGQPSTFDKMLQMGTQLGGAYLLSDRRLKTNIRKVGEVDGMNIYEWDWNEAGKRLAGSQITRGFMADEVREDMLGLSLSGFDMVNYSGYEVVVNA